MVNLKGMSLRWRLTLLIAIVSTLTLAAAFGGFYVLENIKLDDDVRARATDNANSLATALSQEYEKQPDWVPTEDFLKTQLFQYDYIQTAQVMAPDNKSILRFWGRTGSDKGKISLRSVFQKL